MNRSEQTYGWCKAPVQVSVSCIELMEVNAIFLVAKLVFAGSGLVSDIVRLGQTGNNIHVADSTSTQFDRKK